MSTPPVEHDSTRTPDAANAGGCAHASAGDHFVDDYLDELLGGATRDDDVPLPHATPAPAPAPAVPDAAALPATAPTPAPAPAHEAIAPAAAVIVAPRTVAASATVDGGPERSLHAPLAQAMRWLRVAVDADSYALELLRVQEVVRVTPIVRMRGAARAVLGVMNLRGRIVPVFDLGLWLGAGNVTITERARVVVVERNDELIGLLVSAVDDVVTLGRERIEPPMAGNAGGLMAVAIVGIARVGATPTVLLDANALFG